MNAAEMRRVAREVVDERLRTYGEKFAPYMRKWTHIALQEIRNAATRGLFECELLYPRNYSEFAQFGV